MDFYYMPPSAPCRAVEMAALAVGVKLNKKMLNLFKGEHLRSDYLKINPQHTVPTIVDDGFVLWESRAILTYLCDKYDTNNKWLPECPKIRATINQRLYFDMSIFYKSFADYYYTQLIYKAPADPEMLKKVETAFMVFDKFLEGKKFAAGNSVTIADIALVTTMTNFEWMQFDYKKYKNVAPWYEKCKQVIPGFAQNMEACKQFTKYLGAK